MTRPLSFAVDELYHIYNRGTEKRTVFLSVRDYERFLSLLYLCNQNVTVDVKQQGSTLKEILAQPREDTLVDILAYCLMPNHFHLLLREKNTGGISKFMQKVMTGYTMYFNKRNERTGSLFEGKFKAAHISDDVYLKYLVSYIHLNPVKLIDSSWKETGIRDRIAADALLHSYRYSSYLDYANGETARFESAVLHKDALLSFYEERDHTFTFTQQVMEWLNHKPE